MRDTGNLAIGKGMHPRIAMASWLVAAAVLPLILQFHLLPALLSGLLVFELVSQTAPLLQRKFSGRRASIIAASLLAILVLLLAVAMIAGTVAFLRSDAGSLSSLLGKLAAILESARQSLPPWLTTSLPDSAEALHDSVVAWLKLHSAEMQGIGKESGRVLAHVLIGMVIGALVAIEAAREHELPRPLAAAMIERVARLADAFRRVVFAQIRISAINTTLTGIFLVAVMPVLDIHLPLVKTMIVVTFVAGLLPVIGNLISNTLIVVVALSHSLEAGAIGLTFLVVVHKLEYFLNARIVGRRIASDAWEILLAILVMEAVFGLPGLVAAPIYYAYLKDELASAGLV